MIDYTKSELIDSQGNVYTINDLCRISGKNIEWVTSLLDYEVILYDVNGKNFSHHQLHITLKALRLESDLELNTAGVALTLQLLDTIEQQNKELQRLRHLR